jgi:hypothetical protein
MDDNDYLAQIDSDVLLFSDYIFREVINSQQLLIGSGDGITRFGIQDGGLFFLKKSLIQELAAKDIESIRNLLFGTGARKRGDDEAIFILTKEITNKIWLTSYLTYPFRLSLEKIKGMSIRKKKSLLRKIIGMHFISEYKDPMLEYARIFGIVKD